MHGTGAVDRCPHEPEVAAELVDAAADLDTTIGTLLVKGGDRFEQRVTSDDGLQRIGIDAVRSPRRLEQAATTSFVTLMPRAHVVLYYRSGIHRGTVYLARTAGIGALSNWHPLVIRVRRSMRIDETASSPRVTRVSERSRGGQRENVRCDHWSMHVQLAVVGVPTSAGAHHAGQDLAPAALRHLLGIANTPLARIGRAVPMLAAHQLVLLGYDPTDFDSFDAEVLAARPSLQHFDDATALQR